MDSVMHEVSNKRRYVLCVNNGKASVVPKPLMRHEEVDLLSSVGQRISRLEDPSVGVVFTPEPDTLATLKEWYSIMTNKEEASKEKK